MAAAEQKELAGILRRGAGGFVLQADDGRHYRLALLRTPVDEVEKRVVVTGVVNGDHVEADGVRLD